MHLVCMYVWYISLIYPNLFSLADKEEVKKEEKETKMEVEEEEVKEEQELEELPDLPPVTPDDSKDGVKVKPDDSDSPDETSIPPPPPRPGGVKLVLKSPAKVEKKGRSYRKFSIIWGMLFMGSGVS